MKKVHTILAFSTAITCSTLHAEVIPVDVDISATTGDLTYVNLTGFATGSYDTETEQLNFSGGWSTDQGLSVTADWSVEGLTGTATYTACELSIGSCSGQLPLDQALTMDLTLNSVDESGSGSLHENISWENALGSTAFTMFYDVTPVPVPAAAWLFSSAVLALFGLRRRQA